MNAAQTVQKTASELSVRALAARDVGLREDTPLFWLFGTIIESGLMTRVILVDLIRAETTGSLLPQLRSIFPNILAKARADGIARLMIVTQFLHDGFKRFAKHETESLGGTWVTDDWRDYMLFRPQAGDTRLAIGAACCWQRGRSNLG